MRNKKNFTIFVLKLRCMEDVVKIASYICLRYRRRFGRKIDEMKLHKLLYFTQRESIIRTGEPLFGDCFEAWKYGPVLVAIRQRYKNDTLHEELPAPVEERYKKVFDTVFETYAYKNSWSLSSITHGEYAWQMARRRILPEGQHRLIATDDIRKDAERVKIRRFLYEKITRNGDYEDN